MEETSGKSALRRRLREQRLSLAPDEVRRQSGAVCRFLANSFLFRQARAIALYLPVHHEVDPTPLLHLALDLDKRVVLPKVTGRNDPLLFLPWQRDTPLEAGPYGIPEPRTTRPPVPPGELDLLCLPLLGFDPMGVRLGYGGGYYDRTLAPLGREGSGSAGGSVPWLVGLAYGFQEVVRLPRDPHDVVLDWVARENGLLACSPRARRWGSGEVVAVDPPSPGMTNP